MLKEIIPPEGEPFRVSLALYFFPKCWKKTLFPTTLIYLILESALISTACYFLHIDCL